MYERNLAYVCAPAQGEWGYNGKRLAEYCRKIYDAGLTPICPTMAFGTVADRRIPHEKKRLKAMALRELRRCYVLVVCGPGRTASMDEEMSAARDMQMVSTTLKGISEVMEYLEKPKEAEENE